MKAWTSEATMIRAEIAKIEKKQNQQISTLEPTRNIFLQGISAYNDYVDADPDEKRELLSELLWNFSIQDKIVQDFRFKPTYEVIAKEPKPTNFAMMCCNYTLCANLFRAETERMNQSRHRLAEPRRTPKKNVPCFSDLRATNFF